MRKIILIALVLMPLLAAAQTTGFRGRKTIIKTNLVNGVRLPFNSVEVERVFTRTGSISLGVSGSRFELPGQVSTSSSETIDPGVTESVMAHIGFKRYLNRIIPAPQGLYLSFDIGAGAARYDFETLGNFDAEFRPRKAASTFLYMGLPTIGGQTIIANRITLDVKANLDAYYVFLHPVYDYQFLSSNIFAVRFENLIVGPSFYVKLGLLL